MIIHVLKRNISNVPGNGFDMKHKKIVSALMAGMVLSLTPLTSAIAQAQDHGVIVGNSQSMVTGDRIDATKPISLTVKKTGQNPYDDDQSSAPHIYGVKFTLYKVDGVNVLDDKVRKKVMDTYSYKYIKDNNLPSTKTDEGKTDDKGFVSFTGLKPGLYILKEAGSTSDPQVIMLPMVDAQGLLFQYDNLIVAKHIVTDNTPPATPPPPGKTPPETTPPGKQTPPVNTPPVEVPPGDQVTPPATPPQNPPGNPPGKPPVNPPGNPPADTPPAQETKTPLAATPGGNGGGGTPLYPGGPVVDTGGFSIPSVNGENMSLMTMILILSGILGISVFSYRRLSGLARVNDNSSEE